MSEYIDLHCHWVAAIDDGVRTREDGILLLRRLKQAGFSTVVATPHMRPGMFENDRPSLEAAYAAMGAALSEAAANGGGLPEVHLASEHFFDDVVFTRLMRGEALPYPQFGDENRGKRTVLVEFAPRAFPAFLQHRLFDLQRAKLIPVIAHPERYEPVWRDNECLTPLFDAGARLLLDVCSIVGKYGRTSQKAAELLLEEEAYEAACSDAHSPADVDTVEKAILRLTELVGAAETNRLLVDGPRTILGYTRS